MQKFQTIVLGLGIVLMSSAAQAHLIYVSNEKDNTVSIIDSNSMQVTKTFEVGRRPRGITFSHDFKQFFVCAGDSNAVQVFDTTENKHLYDLPSGEDPEQFALAPDGRHLFIANENNAVTTIVDIIDKSVHQIDVGVEPEGMAVSPDGKVAVTTSETSSMVHWIDTEKFEQIATTLVDQRPRYAQFNRDGSLLWASSEVGGTLSVIDTKSHEKIKTIAFNISGVSRDKIQPVGFKLTSDGRYAFVALGPANHVAVVDAKSYEVLKYIVVGRRVWHVALTPEEDKAYVTNGVSGDVTEIDVKTLEATRTVKVGRYPWGVAVLPTK